MQLKCSGFVRVRLYALCSVVSLRLSSPSLSCVVFVASCWTESEAHTGDIFPFPSGSRRISHRFHVPSFSIFSGTLWPPWSSVPLPYIVTDPVGRCGSRRGGGGGDQPGRVPPAALPEVRGKDARSAAGASGRKNEAANHLISTSVLPLLSQPEGRDPHSLPPAPPAPSSPTPPQLLPNSSDCSSAALIYLCIYLFMYLSF